MFWRKRQPPVSSDQALAARPIKLADVTVEPMDNGGARLKARVKPTRWGRLIFRLPDSSTKTFELDAIGLFVWECCDGKTSVEQIIKRLASRHSLSLRQSQLPTLKFLQMLSRRGLIGLALPEEKSTRRRDG